MSIPVGPSVCSYGAMRGQKDSRSGQVLCRCLTLSCRRSDVSFRCEHQEESGGGGGGASTAPVAADFFPLPYFPFLSSRFTSKQQQ